ncbi:FAD-dependent oxidoreductase [Anoxybacillus ayderensis]|uniref:FAD-dependent oxidoreductase n=1 Tax=Anoxybacillus ayderensis TaxID=265546 RepID=UPI002E23B0B5|nr:FAD-dependent oxidoreductase [Anoxybacillus ayderensis]
MSLPKLSQSYWLQTTTIPSFPSLTQPIETDVAIIGGGITGITTAYLLAKQGVRVTVIEADRLCHGTTGHTTAKMTAQHDLIYHELIAHFGEDSARQYYEANKEALQSILHIVKEHDIHCDLSVEDAYVYTTEETQLYKLEAEWKAYETLGIDGAYVDQLSLPFSIQGAVMMRNQAQFHPLHYIKTLVELAVKYGASFYEQTVAQHIETTGRPIVRTKNGATITCDTVVICTHFPFFDPAFYFARLHAERSYVIAVEAHERLQGMYLSANEPKRSLRCTTMDGKPLLLIGGESHKVGQGINMIQHYEALQSFCEHTFGLSHVLYRWSAQDLITLDNLPYIGPIRKSLPHILVATGYRKWGMTTSMVAARLLTDLALQKEHRYAHLFTPSRFIADPSLNNLFTEGIDVAKHFLTGKLEYALRTPHDISKGEGAVVNVDGKRAGAYRDEQGTLYVIDTTCTHMGCELEWNNSERSWDCPCHGSRFCFTGKVLEGPAIEPLQQLKGDE